MIFLHDEKNNIWYFRILPYFLEYIKLLQKIPNPNWNVVGELLNNYFKKYSHSKSTVITTEDIYKTFSADDKKKILIKTGNVISFTFVRYTSFYVSFKRHNQRQVEKIPDLLQYCIYEGEYELTNDDDLRFIKTTYRDFKLTHLYK